MKKTSVLVLDISSGKVIRDGAVIGKLNYNERLILGCLIDNAGEIVSREILLNVGWPDRVVVPNSLNIAMRNIRAAIEIAGHVGEPETVPKLGFKLSKGIIYNTKSVEVEVEVEVESERCDLNTSIGKDYNKDKYVLSSYFPDKKKIIHSIMRNIITNAGLHRRIYFCYVFFFIFLSLYIQVSMEAKKPTLYCSELRGGEICSASESDLEDYMSGARTIQFINDGDKYFIMEVDDELISVKVN